MSIRSTATAVSGDRLTWPDRADAAVWEPGGAFVRQWRTMTARALRSAWSQSEFVIAIAMPLVFALGFYLPLRLIMAERGIDYAQFLMPIIVLQAVAFTAVAAAQRAALDRMRGMTRRLTAMPVHPLVPLLSRMSVTIVRVLLSICAALAFGALLGFSFNGGVIDTAGFIVFAIAVSLVLGIGADTLGVMARSAEATSQLLVLPQLVLGLLSTGFVPESGFPDWAQPFARNQPISHFSTLMRELADGHPGWNSALPSLLWLAGLAVVFIAAAHHAQTHRRAYL
ncbi:antibiotic transporter [Gordonia amarae]|uniref:Antibiotic transporter n=2 Tax=Gordonia amarae TaxID=36821 RepID=A0A857KLC0_9ACTN|nr:ABC transporter permease [Gordonia amarae]MCS3879445.1 ABC-2 type transport system permease protein [Gordonia amarae]QHN17915.1 antibiotic transporter [Gordonia amarae]QHN22437.1 antibiotic transporter [Gordonia amarae]QHN40058.1 antibiotic transporter [Gordonia amarae]GAB06600.1 putative ABC transporter permease protein [Gordonia amarae NBRC 15530]